MLVYLTAASDKVGLINKQSLIIIWAASNGNHASILYEYKAGIYNGPL